jgi:uncharacterized protein (TIGR03083 family)
MEETMIRDWIAAERRELATTLDRLSPGQWDAPSLCDGWTVRHVIAHLTMPFRYSKTRFMLELVKSGGRFSALSDTVARRDATLPAAQLIAAIRDNAEHPWRPPGGGYAGALTHDVIHSLDITRPLEIDLPIPAEPMRVVLDTVSGPKPRRFFGVDVSGTELRATDLDWSFGSGPPLLGRAQDLALLLTGRRAPAGALSGPGAARWEGALSGPGAARWEGADLEEEADLRAGTVGR